MALSPADFAAYSRATGTPYPEDPEERAQLAPEVASFRRDQLQAPKQESNLPGILGATALGLGALAGGVGLARSLGRTKASVASSPQPDLTPKGRSDVAVVDRYARQRAAEDLTRQARSERSAGVVQADLSNVQVKRSLMPTEAEAIEQYSRRLSQDFPEPTASEMEALNAPSRTSKILARLGTSPQYRPDPKDINYPRFGPPSPEVAAARREQASQDLLRFAQQRQEDAALVTNQTMGALESGEDQMTGRTMMGVQRNEDLDASQVNNVARQTGSADVAASLTPDGVPVDQTDPWGQPTIPQIKKTQQGSTPLLPAAAASPREKAQEFLQSRFEELGVTIPGRYRRERAMGMDTEIAEAAELYAATGDPSVLSRFSTNAASPLTIKPAVQMDVNSENLPTSQFYKSTGYPENVGDLFERDVELTNEISSLGAQQQALIAKNKELGEQELMLRVAMDRDPEGGGAYTNMFGKLKFEQQNLPDPTIFNVDLGDALEERSFIRNQIKSLESLGPTFQLKDLQEGVRPFFEYDAQGDIIPQTLELRTGRSSVDLDPKTGGGRLVSEYDPEGQSGSTRGIYGIEQTSRRSAPTTQPTGMTMDELIREGMEQAKASPEGDVPIPPSISDLTEQQVTPQKRSSVNMSEAILRASRLQGNRNPRGGVLPDEITMTRRQLEQLDLPKDTTYAPRETITPGSVPPQQLNLKNVTGYSARRVDTPADIAANQLEEYMSKLQRGRSTPLTSQAVIQPRLF
jgi:cell envelope opacity-associated protein A